MEKINLTLPGDNDYFVQEAYKVLRTNLQFCGMDVKVVALTSCHENEGKTTVVLSLAKSLADLGKQVLVIDADMRKSVMAGRNTNVQNPCGLSEMLVGQKKFGECIYKAQYERLHIMFAGKYPPNPVELLAGRYFASLLGEVRKYYDYILIDTPPLGEVIDAAVIAQNCDGAILVLGDENVRRGQALDVLEQLKKSGCRVLGAIRNKVQKNGSKYYGKKRYQ